MKETEPQSQTANASALSDAERLELENYRREEKIRIINEYQGDLDEAILDSFREKVDSFTKDELIAKLAIEYRTFTINNKEDQYGYTRPIKKFTAIPVKDTYNEYDAGQVIKKYKK